ncbi:MAG: ArsR/SmtB family transcription factor [Candidatus Bipolaricaulaceae bacterium]
MDLRKIAAELSRLAEALSALAQQPPPPAVEALARTAPSDLASLVRRTLEELAALLPGEGVRVFLVGLHRHQGHTTSWYQLFTEGDVPEVLKDTQGLRALALLAQPERLRLLFALTQGVTDAAQLMKTSGLTQGQFYHHLRALEAADLARKRGRDHYVPTLSGISALFSLLAVVNYLSSKIAEPEGEEESRT